MASKVLCILALVAAGSAALDSRLMGGSELDVREAPYVVSIKYTYPGPGITIQRCVGSLISSWHVVTTATCFNGANIQNMRVQAGSTNSLGGGVSRAVTRFVTHPDFRATPRTADVAVLFVAQPYGITDSINVLYLPPTNFDLPTGSEIKIVGWGFDAPSGTPQLENLHAMDLVTLPKAECAQSVSADTAVIDDNVICASGEGKGICRGDSGAPAVASNVLVGVSSLENCGSAPDVLTSVAGYSAWILSVAVAPANEGVPVRMATV